MHAAFEDQMTHGFCNSHCLSQFAAFFIGTETKISTVENFHFGLNGIKSQVTPSEPKFIRRFKVSAKSPKRNSEKDYNGVNDPTAGSPTVTLLRLLLPLSDKVYLTSLIAKQFSPESLPDHSKSVGATGGVYKGQGRNRHKIMTCAY